MSHNHNLNTTCEIAWSCSLHLSLCYLFITPNYLFWTIEVIDSEVKMFFFHFYFIEIVFHNVKISLFSTGVYSLPWKNKNTKQSVQFKHNLLKQYSGLNGLHQVMNPLWLQWGHFLWTWFLSHKMDTHVFPVRMVVTCSLREPILVKRSPQSLHMDGFSPLCLSVLPYYDSFPQTWQLYGLPPVWVLIWTVTWVSYYIFSTETYVAFPLRLAWTFYQ